MDISRSPVTYTLVLTENEMRDLRAVAGLAGRVRATIEQFYATATTSDVDPARVQQTLLSLWHRSESVFQKEVHNG